ncbi:hypothetical protein, partial [Streptomyces sp. NPDC059979]|uniref:hypothetical protein n=1 Tax=Streptomyces sp. NPDC059979 TaxID=3347021 RepID=UPI00369458FA
PGIPGRTALFHFHFTCTAPHRDGGRTTRHARREGADRPFRRDGRAGSPPVRSGRGGLRHGRSRRRSHRHRCR